MQSSNEKEKFRLATKDGVTLDELIEQGQIETALAFIEIELTRISHEIGYLKGCLKKIKKLLEAEKQ